MTDVQQAVTVAQEKAYRFAGEVSSDAASHLAIRSPLNRVIYKAVRDYRLSNMAYADDQGGAYPLVDLMSNPAPSDIGTGEMEMISLVDEIQMAIEAAGMSLSLPCKSGEGAGEAIFKPSEREAKAIAELMVDTELSAHAVMRQALMLYQSDHMRRKAGETVSWSGDEQRARDFAGVLALTPDATQTREAELREALTPYDETKAAYMGEFSWTEWLPDEDGIDQGHVRVVPWTTIKEVMAAIRERAGVDKLDTADCLAALNARGGA